MKNILIFSPYAINTPHLETELELAQLHLDDGDQVYWLGCDRGLPGCDVNHDFRSATCASCVCRRQKGISLLQNTERFKELSPVSSAPDVRLENLKGDFVDLEDLKSYFIDNFDIGYGVLSSLISIFRTPSPDVIKYRVILNRSIQSAAKAFFRLRDAISEHQIDHLYVHNGRYGMLRAAVRAAEYANISFDTVEVGCDNHHYHLFRNVLPHDADYWRQDMAQLWDSVDPVIREKIGRSFYEARAAKCAHWWKNFGEAMEDGKLPESWTRRQPLPIFISSEDEMASIGESHQNLLYPDGGQLEAIDRILKDLELLAENRYLVYLRMHPNMPADDSFAAAIHQFAKNRPWVVVIPPSSDVDSYAILRRADRVVSFGSTIGAEAVFWGTPSIIATTAFFFPKEVGYQPKTHAEVMELILREHLEATDITPAIVYGYYSEKFGKPYKFYQSENIFAGKFRGVRIRGYSLVSVASARQLLRSICKSIRSISNTKK